MTRSAASSLSIDTVARFLWGAALFTLPVTSFRYFPLLGDATYVRPLSLYPIAFLLPLLVIQLLRGKVSMPQAGALTPLTAFVLFVLAATSLGNPARSAAAARAGIFRTRDPRLGDAADRAVFLRLSRLDESE